MSEVLDASALLAVLLGKPEGANVDLSSAVVSSVSLAEVLTYSTQHGRPTHKLLDEFELLGLVIYPFSTEAAVIVGGLSSARSLEERACLATAEIENRVAVTAKRGWEVQNVEVRFL